MADHPLLSPPEPTSLPDTTKTDTALQEDPQVVKITPTDVNEPSSQEVKRREWWPFLWLFYLVGVAWHGLHPIASVFTGQAHARGWYIDENSLDPSHFRMDTQRHYPTIFRPPKASDTPLLPISPCARLTEGTRNVDCHTYDANYKFGFDLIRILPASNAVAPVSEAIVLVVPFASDWRANAFHNSLLRLMERLSTAPWLAKTILIVSPTNDTISLEDCVDRFLESYQGSRTRTKGQSLPNVSADASAAGTSTGTCSSSNTTGTNHLDDDYQLQSSLPSSWTGAMIRQLVVLETHANTTETGEGDPMHELRILPAGRRGVLPNMDLVVLVKNVYARCRFLQKTQGPRWNTQTPRWNTQTVVHPFSAVAQQWSEWIRATLPTVLHKWATDIVQLVLFEYTLAVGPYPAHASALDRGIDSLTVQVHISGNETADKQAAHLSDYVQKTEAVIRGLSNLHERLHHSTSLYIVPTEGKFVKHEEYLVPNLLLLIPLVIRALTLALFDIPRFHLGAVRWAVTVTLVGTVAVALIGLPLVEWIFTTYPSWAFTDSLLASHKVVAAVFAAILFLRSQWKPVLNANALQSIQFIACLVAVYIHVPIAFGHVSLAFPSAFLWTPLIAFPSFRKPISPTRSFLSVLLFLATAPPVLLVPRIFAGYTPYVKFAYIPLHLLVSCLYLVSTNASLARATN
jgi:glycosylphosphatidylinositol transamidase